MRILSTLNNLQWNQKVWSDYTFEVHFGSFANTKSNFADGEIEVEKRAANTEKNIFLLVATHFSAFFLVFIGGCFEFGWWKNLFSYPDREKLWTFFLLFWLPYSLGGCDIFPSMHLRFTFFPRSFHPLLTHLYILNENSIHSIVTRCLSVGSIFRWVVGQNSSCGSMVFMTSLLDAIERKKLKNTVNENKFGKLKFQLLILLHFNAL